MAHRAPESLSQCQEGAKSDLLSMEVKVAKMLEDGDTWIGGFENADLGHPEIGRRCLFPFGNGDFAAAEIGKTHAPDGRYIGMGWRYILKLKTTDAGAAARWLLRMEFE